jgi:hypothetical protein
VRLKIKFKMEIKNKNRDDLKEATAIGRIIITVILFYTFVGLLILLWEIL